jgi:hypothetical protein
LRIWVTDLPRKMLWTELLFSYFPIDKTIVWQQMLARFFFLFAVWLSGLVAHALDGLMTDYILDLNVYPTYFGTSFIILFGSYFVQHKLSSIIQVFRPMLKLDDMEFQKFSRRLERVSYRFFPCLLVAVGLGAFSGALNQYQQALAEGVQLHVIWNLSFNSFGLLLTATAIWMFVSIWLTIFLISRQPLNVKLSSETIARFREMSMLALWFSLFYFVGVSIGNITYFTSAQAFSLTEVLISPYLFFIAIGVVGIIFPFYNIHMALLKMKQRELSKISEESQQLLKQLDDALGKQATRQEIDKEIVIMHYRLFSLQVQEKHVMAAQEWPIDLSFLSKLLVLVFIPIISRIVAMLIIS